MFLGKCERLISEGFAGDLLLGRRKNSLRPWAADSTQQERDQASLSRNVNANLAEKRKGRIGGGGGGGRGGVGGRGRREWGRDHMRGI